MLFNSFSFAIFLPIVFALYWCIPEKLKWVLILLASYYFYMNWNVKYVILILLTTVVSYTAAILLEKTDADKIKKMILILSAILCLGLLFFFKYFNFLCESAVNLLQLFSIKLNPLTLKLLLPVGISFYTFQTLSYVIDVYKGRITAEHHFGYYATYISFFPQLVAGPIERTNNLLPQIKKKHVFEYEQATYGVKLMIWGYFKKIVIADTLSVYVSTIYDRPENYTGFALILATIFFTIQIYCDFSGYSDIAIGTAKLFGINLMNNFESPYFSQSIKEFWSRWHISLSTWFRDYVYIPLGGNRVSKTRHNLNIIITFAISGLWHGANWTYVIWGMIHGGAQILEDILPAKLKHKNVGFLRWFRIGLVFLFVSFAWVFFRADSIRDAVYIITHFFDGLSHPGQYFKTGLVNIGIEMDKILWLKLIILIVILSVYDMYSLKIDVIGELSKKNLLIRWIIYVSMLLIIVFLSQKGVAAEFVYFQF